MSNLVPDITRFNHQRRSDHALNVKTPIADVRDDVVAIVSPDVLTLESCSAVRLHKSASKRIGPGTAHRRSIGNRIWRAEDALIQQVEPVAPVRRAGVQGVVGRIEDTRRNAENGIRRRTVGKAYARTKSFLVGVERVLARVKELEIAV